MRRVPRRMEMSRRRETISPGRPGCRRRRSGVLAALLLALLLASPLPAAAQENARERNIAHELARATALVNAGRFDDAIGILERLAVALPENDDVAAQLSLALRRAGRAEEAVHLVERRLGEDGTGAFVLLRELGQALLALDRPEEAAGAWERILLDERTRDAYASAVASLEQDAGLWDRALATLERARETSGNPGVFTRRIVRLLRLLGRPRAAFREALRYVAGIERRDVSLARDAIDIFRGAGRPADLLAAADSAAAGGDPVFRLLHALLLAEAGRPIDRYIGGDRRLDEPELGRLVARLGEAGPASGDAFDEAAAAYLDRHPETRTAPFVVVLVAERLRSQGRAAADPARRAGLLERAAALADSVAAGMRSYPLRERALLVRAGILLDDLRRPDEAAGALGGIGRPPGAASYAVEELRVRALLGAADRAAAARVLREIAASVDSAVAAIGRWGIGMLTFLEGNDAGAVAALSELAEDAPWSEQANDALETALLIQGALRDERPGALARYRVAANLAARGRTEAAADTLAVLAARYPSSSLAPRARFERARLLGEAGRTQEMRGELRRIADRYPGHEFAARALEESAASLERSDPAAALAGYEELAERFPEDPFIERVRARIARLRARGAGEGGETP